jgi:hypothetical protein
MVFGDSRPAAAVARELGIGGGNLRRWVKEATGREWAEQVARHFGFLTRHGFVLTDVAPSTAWEVWVTYRSNPLSPKASPSRLAATVMRVAVRRERRIPERVTSHDQTCV